MTPQTLSVSLPCSDRVCVADVQPLVDFLKAIEVGSVVLMASFDDPATK